MIQPFIITKFNVGVFSHEVPTPPSRKGPQSPEEWTLFRLSTMRHWTALSVSKQVKSGVLWLILVDKATPSDLVEELRKVMVDSGLTEDTPTVRYKLVFTEEEYYPTFKETDYGLKQIIWDETPKEAKAIATMNLSSDTLISRYVFMNLNFVEPTQYSYHDVSHNTLVHCTPEGKYISLDLQNPITISSSAICVHPKTRDFEICLEFGWKLPVNATYHLNHHATLISIVTPNSTHRTYLPTKLAAIKRTETGLEKFKAIMVYAGCTVHNPDVLNTN